VDERNSAEHVCIIVAVVVGSRAAQTLTAGGIDDRERVAGLRDEETVQRFLGSSRWMVMLY
jgi:hypothetical protein